MSCWHPRRKVLILGAGAIAGLALPRLGAAQELPLTPRCDRPVTASQTEGPFFKPQSPRRSDFREPGFDGELVTLAGLVLSRDCRPIENALVELWHADAMGDYDNRGFRGRGHQFTDAQGRFGFVTILPARYTGRTRHFHVKVQAEKGPVLTTQLYFPDEPGNARDPLFRRELQMALFRNGAERMMRFTFVVERS